MNSNIKLDSELLLDYINRFFGYGNLNSPYWFIGKEEGGDKTVEMNLFRMKTWEKFSKTTTVDIFNFHKSLGYSDKQLQNLQPTWTKLIQILFTLENGKIDKESIKNYLYSNFGRFNCNHCLLELMPLPARSTSIWLYKGYTNEIPELASRDKYMKSFVQSRIKTLKKLVNTHKPKLVVFYSTTPDYLQYWSVISDNIYWNWEKWSSIMKVAYVKKGKTLFVICPHPTAYGIRNDDFNKLGLKIQQYLSV